MKQNMNSKTEKTLKTQKIEEEKKENPEFSLEQKTLFIRLRVVLNNYL